MLLLALALGLLIGAPQLVATLQYYPQSVRAQHGAEEKQAMGNLTFGQLLQGLVCPRRLDQLDGVLYPETTTYVGYGTLLAACLCPWGPWQPLLVFSALLTMGKHTPVFRWCSPLLLRIPARCGYAVSLCLILLALGGLMAHPLPPHWLPVGVCLQGMDLAFNTARLMPHRPYVQRWERPSRAFTTPLLTFLAGKDGRVSGLPYPARTGHIPRIHTLGYHGGFQPLWMWRLRGDPDPNGSGAHDWFQFQEDGPFLDWYGVRYAYTYVPPRGEKWRPTGIPHLYENRQCQRPPSWEDLAGAA